MVRAHTAALRIGEFARRVDVSPELLRAWERRYRAVVPHRTAGGQRVYSAADIARLTTLARSVSRQQEVNRRILETSSGMITSSLSLCSRMLGGCQTYGAHGRISNGMAGISLLRREV